MSGNHRFVHRGCLQDLQSRTAADAQRHDTNCGALDLETIEDVLRNVSKVMVDKKGGPGVIPYLPLPELKPNQNPGGVSLPRTPPPPLPPSTATGGSR